MSNTTFCSTAPQIGCYAETSAASLAACWAASGTPSYVFQCAEGNKLLCTGSNVTAIQANFNSSSLPNRCISTRTTSGGSPAKSSGSMLFLLVVTLSAFGVIISA